MKLKKIVSSVLAAALCALSLTGCSNGGNSGGSSANESSAVTESSANTTSSAASGNSSAVSAPESSVPVSSAPDSSTPDRTEPTKAEVRIVALKGPTAMGLTKMIEDGSSELDYKLDIKAAPDEISPMVAQGSADIFCVPANLAAVLSNKTEGKVQVAAINTLGVLYICEKGETVKSVADLKGKTIYSAGKGSTPEYALNFILRKNGLDPEKDVTIEWKSEHAECLEAMLKGENCVAMLPQPFVTTAQTKNDAVKVVLDLNAEWDKLGVDSSLITGVAIVRREFAEKNPEVVKTFLKQYKESVDYINANVDEAAKLIGKYDIVPEAVAKKAIPNCNIVCITGADMKGKLSGYLNVLFENDPKAVGGKLPDDTFYFVA